MEYTLTLSHDDMLRLYHALLADTDRRKSTGLIHAYANEISRNERLAETIWNKLSDYYNHERNN